MEKNNKFASHASTHEDRFLLTSHFKNIILVGATGVGKSAVGFQLSKMIGFGLYDTDAQIEKLAQKSILRIFNEDGEEAFRELESTVVGRLSSIRNHVIVCGAGLTDREENRQGLRDLGVSVWLDVAISEVVSRFMAHPEHLETRPMLKNVLQMEGQEERRKALYERLESIFKNRKILYEEAAISVVCGYATPIICAQSIKSALLRRANHPEENVDKAMPVEE